jgi:membrane protein
MIIGILIAGLFFDNAQAQVMGEVKGLLGDEGGKAIESMISAAQKPMESTIATVLAVATLFFGAAGVFVQLKDAERAKNALQGTTVEGRAIGIEYL